VCEFNEYLKIYWYVLQMNNDSLVLIGYNGNNANNQYDNLQNRETK
jgi:hypothetical protein